MEMDGEKFNYDTQKGMMMMVKPHREPDIIIIAK